MTNQSETAGWSARPPRSERRAALWAKTKRLLWQGLERLGEQAAIARSFPPAPWY